MAPFHQAQKPSRAGVRGLRFDLPRNPIQKTTRKALAYNRLPMCASEMKPVRTTCGAVSAAFTLNCCWTPCVCCDAPKRSSVRRKAPAVSPRYPNFRAVRAARPSGAMDEQLTQYLRFPVDRCHPLAKGCTDGNIARKPMQMADESEAENRQNARRPRRSTGAPHGYPRS